MYEIEIVELTPSFAAVVTATKTVPEIHDFLMAAFQTVLAAVPDADPKGEAMARYDMAGDGLFRIDGGFPVGTPVEPTGDVHTIELPGGPAARTMHIGPYEDVAAAYQAMDAWFGANGWRPAGAPWETYLDEAGVEKPRTIVTWPCARTTA